MTRLKSAIWLITWNCNLQCPYCWQRHAKLKHAGFLPNDKLAAAWNELRPGTLEISGGEPFTQPDFIGLIRAISPDIQLAMSTNLSHDIMAFLDATTPDRVCWMTLSLHPSAHMNVDQFLGRALLLKRRGYSSAINFVAYPEQMYMIPHFKERCDKLGLRFHVDPFGLDNYSMSEQEKEFLRPFIESDRANAMTDAVRPVMCSAGTDHLVALPDGNLYRCMKAANTGAEPIGNLLKMPITRPENPIFCPDYNRCPGCNRDKVTVTDAKETP